MSLDVVFFFPKQSKRFVYGGKSVYFFFCHNADFAALEKMRESSFESGKLSFRAFFFLTNLAFLFFQIRHLGGYISFIKSRKLGAERSCLFYFFRFLAQKAQVSTDFPPKRFRLFYIFIRLLKLSFTLGDFKVINTKRESVFNHHFPHFWRCRKDSVGLVLTYDMVA